MIINNARFKQAVFLDAATIKPSELDLTALEPLADSWTFHASTRPEQTLARMETAELIITNKVVLDKPLLQQTRSLKLICICATGTNNVDLDAARELGITVCNVSGYAAASVAQHTMALLLSLATSLNQYNAAVQNGDWSKSPFFCLLDYPAFELSGKTFGVVGYGSLGKAAAKMAEALGMTVLVAQPPWRDQQTQDRTPWSTFLEKCDVISIHCPLTPESKYLFNQETLSCMKQGALLINTARGGIVHEEDLLEALLSKHLRGAALDVLEQEPPAPNHPLISAKLPNLLITPHSAWVATECRQRLMDGVTQNIKAFLNGSPKNAVN
ncbi:glycerate dehydrogenase [Oleiphilus sp. HI0130]|nr:glycerate dehydrogenase [Oleiphilus sp. HI0130]